MTRSFKEIGIGIIGFGTVGSGTVKLLRENAELLRRRGGGPPRVVKGAALDLDRDRGFSLPREILTTDGFQVTRHPDIHIVCELVGGKGAALEFLHDAIRQGKSVVTANKALLAEHGMEISKAATAAGVDIGFEASVGGGIPIIRAMREGLAANRIQ